MPDAHAHALGWTAGHDDVDRGASEISGAVLAPPLLVCNLSNWSMTMSASRRKSFLETVPSRSMTDLSAKSRLRASSSSLILC